MLSLLFISLCLLAVGGVSSSSVSSEDMSAHLGLEDLLVTLDASPRGSLFNQSVRQLHPIPPAGKVHPQIVIHKVSASLVLFVLTLSGCSLPFLLQFYTKQRQSNSYSSLFRIMNAWAGGAFLALGLFHLLPESFEMLQEANYVIRLANTEVPLVAPMLTFCGFSLIFFLEQVICCHGDCIEHIKPAEEGRMVWGAPNPCCDGSGSLKASFGRKLKEGSFQSKSTTAWRCNGLCDDDANCMFKPEATNSAQCEVDFEGCDCGDGKKCGSSGEFPHKKGGCCCGNHSGFHHNTDVQLRDSSPGFWYIGNRDSAHKPGADTHTQPIPEDTDETPEDIEPNEDIELADENNGTTKTSLQPQTPTKRMQRVGDIFLKFVKSSYCWIGFALIIHSLFEGIVVGTCSTPTNVWMTTLVILGHKIAAGFALATVLLKKLTEETKYSIYGLILLFVTASPVGIYAGQLAHEDGTVGVLTALSTGTVLYIACEIVLELHDSPQTHHDSLYFRLMKFSFFLLGGAIVLGLTLISALI